MGPGALLIPTLLREKYHCDNPEAMFIPCCNYPFDEARCLSQKKVKENLLGI